MSARASSVEFRVRYAETDQMGVVYHSHYLVWCEIGRTDHIRGLGLSYREMEEQGVTLAVAEASIRYTAPARYDDLIRVDTTLFNFSSRALVYDYLITNADNGVRLATARTTLISLDSTGRVVALPRNIRALLARASEQPA